MNGVCENLQQRLYEGQPLTADELAHLDHCQACAQTRLLMELLQEPLDDPAPPPALDAAILAAARGPAQAPLLLLRRLDPILCLKWGVAAAAALFLVAVGGYLWANRGAAAPVPVLAQGDEPTLLPLDPEAGLPAPTLAQGPMLPPAPPAIPVARPPLALPPPPPAAPVLPPVVDVPPAPPVLARVPPPPHLEWEAKSLDLDLLEIQAVLAMDRLDDRTRRAVESAF